MVKTTLILATSLFLSCEMTDKEVDKMMINNRELLTVDDQTVVFYNVENLFDTEDDRYTDDDDFTPHGDQSWTHERYLHKLNQIAKVLYDIGNQAPMIIGLVEIENYKVIKDLAKTGGLSRTNYAIAHFDSDDRRGIDCALMFDSSRFTIARKEKLQVKLPNNPNYLTRDILYVAGHIKSGEVLHVFANHWSSRREGTEETEPKRTQAASVLKNKIKEILLADPAAKILVMGDFNDEPKDKSIQQVLNAAGRQAFLYNLLADAAQDGEGTIVHQREWLMFDQMMVSQNLLEKNGVHVKHQRAFVYRPEEILFTYRNGGQKPNSTYGGNEYYGGFSDHLPVYLTLKE